MNKELNQFMGGFGIYCCIKETTCEAELGYPP